MVYIEIANPKRVLINSKEDYINFIKKNNKISNLYRTVYNFKYLRTKFTPEYESAIINQMFFDCDSKNSLEVCKKFVKYLDDNDLQYYLKQSSFHKFPKLQIYSLTTIETLNYKKNALMNAMVHLAIEIGLSYGESVSCDLDKATFGDLARICPIPGTYKPKRKSYCSYISKDDLYDIDILKERAKYGNGKKVIYNNKKFSLKPFDYIDSSNIVCNGVIIDKDDFNIEFNNKLVDCLPPFIKKILSNHKNYCDNYLNRWRAGIYLRDMGYPESLTEKILKENYSKHLNWSTMNGRGTQWDRFVKCKALYYIYHSEFKEFPSITTLLNEGYEITKEDEEAFNKLYG